MVLAATGLALALAGCAGGQGLFSLFGSPYPIGTGAGTGTGTGTGPGGTGVGSGGTGGMGGGSGTDRTPTDPCLETQARKFIRVSMRNESPNEFIHYFVAFVAFVNDPNGQDGFIDGGVCPNDLNLYRSNGYSIEILAGQQQDFGNYCITGPALIYFYQNGAFRQPGGTAGSTNNLASAIAPAQGTAPTFDGFFTSAGAQIPVPDFILFHNPGTGEGARLKVSRNNPDPCGSAQNTGAANCLQDAFYYVDDTDLFLGSPTLGIGSARRVPNEIQGSSCQSGLNFGYAVLAPSGISAANALDYEFLRGGKIEFVFIRDDQTPPFPQLLWKVTDSRGTVAHNFDPRAGITK
jgi:hypothetical protein